MFEFGEDLLDRVQVGTVWRQEQQVGAGISDGLSDSCVFVAGKIVHNDHIAWLAPNFDRPAQAG